MEKDLSKTVEHFIRSFSYSYQGKRGEVVDCFLNGRCYWFARILKERFVEEETEIMIDYVVNHFGTMIGCRVYDITGDVTDRYNWQKWSDCDDELLRSRIVKGCIQ